MSAIYEPEPKMFEKSRIVTHRTLGHTALSREQYRGLLSEAAISAGKLLRGLEKVFKNTRSQEFAFPNITKDVNWDEDYGDDW